MYSTYPLPTEWRDIVDTGMHLLGEVEEVEVEKEEEECENFGRGRHRRRKRISLSYSLIKS
jgi:hypothetical protein